MFTRAPFMDLELLNLINVFLPRAINFSIVERKKFAFLERIRQKTKIVSPQGISNNRFKDLNLMLMSYVDPGCLLLILRK